MAFISWLDIHFTLYPKVGPTDLLLCLFVLIISRPIFILTPDPFIYISHGDYGVKIFYHLVL